MSLPRITEILERDEIILRLTSEGLPTAGLFDGLTVKYLDGALTTNIYYKGNWYPQ